MPLIIKRIFNRIGRPIGVNPFPRAFENELAEGSSAKKEELFENIFKRNYWGGISRSGVGSEESFAQSYAKRLTRLIQDRNFTAMFDAPCGDLAWMPAVISQTGISYSGGDISASLIEATQPKHPNIALSVFDLRQDTLPNVDIWHCRDCLFHLSFVDILAVLTNAIKSDCEYALLTTHRSRLMHKNLDVGTGGFRFLDLQKPPFNLPKAEEYLKDYIAGNEFPRYVALWKVSDLSIAIEGLKDHLNTQGGEK